MRSEEEIREYIRVLDDTRKRLVKKGKEAYTTVHDAEINALEWVLQKDNQ